MQCSELMVTGSIPSSRLEEAREKVTEKFPWVISEPAWEMRELQAAWKLPPSPIPLCSSSAATPYRQSPPARTERKIIGTKPLDEGNLDSL